jgi:beta-phosphoglucomutase-like phosphatase (HAD superfamily)
MAITTAQIHQAANQIDKEGKRPTLAGVRTVLGGGSFSTIQEAMKTWKRAEDEEAVEASPVPTDLADAAETMIAKLWEIGEKLAAEALDHERNSFHEELFQANEARDDAVSAADDIAEEMSKLNNDLSIANYDRKELIREVEALKECRENLRKDLAIANANTERQASIATERMEQIRQLETIVFGLTEKVSKPAARKPAKPAVKAA